MARRRTAFVPRAVLGASFGSVVPACVALGIQACGSGPIIGVAAVAYCCFEAGKGDGDADASDSAQADAPSETSADVTSDATKD
jgi:hypothetical protein